MHVIQLFSIAIIFLTHCIFTNTSLVGFGHNKTSHGLRRLVMMNQLDN